MTTVTFYLASDLVSAWAPVLVFALAAFAVVVVGHRLPERSLVLALLLAFVGAGALLLSSALVWAVPKRCAGNEWWRIILWIC